MILSDEIKKVFLAGIGAMALTAEKSKELLDQMVAKGELTVEQGKVINEELKRKAKDELNQMVTVKVAACEPGEDGKTTKTDETTLGGGDALEGALKAVKALNEQQLAALKAALSASQNPPKAE
ncbi:MAG: hypothetical protein PHD32_04710 [Eubacteriales bacterium]|nr:hypothetical protein [Eubacteriales bacterium]